jgi:hypothetical protein
MDKSIKKSKYSTKQLAIKVRQIDRQKHRHVDRQLWVLQVPVFKPTEESHSLETDTLLLVFQKVCHVVSEAGESPA